MQQTFFCGSGNVGSNISLKTHKGKEGKDVSVLNFSMRQRVTRKNSETGEYEDSAGFWIDVEQWGRMAELNHQFLKTGCMVTVSGMLFQKTWEMTQGENAGKTSSTMALRADTVAFSALGIQSIVFTEKSPRPQSSAPQSEQTAATESASTETPPA